MLCPFCALKTTGNRLPSNRLAIVVEDKYPISRGHTLIIPRRHVSRVAALKSIERAALWGLIPKVLQVLSKRYSPNGFNIGLNDGIAAGQTVPHLHLHIIPRYKGDVKDPRGGVRWVLRKKAKYWKD
ncbi:MAG TPA: HIT family protein [Elusimicrobia bacterium]|nr:HIT family protein [Elusimicrobiota bacterium]